MTKAQIEKKIKELIQAINSEMFTPAQAMKMKAEVGNLRELYERKMWK